MTLLVTNRAAVEASILRFTDEWLEPYALTDATRSRSSTRRKTRAQLDREQVFIKGMCEAAFRFTGDRTPSELYLRLCVARDAEVKK